jgi:transcription elongation factor Elf1
VEWKKKRKQKQTFYLKRNTLRCDYTFACFSVSATQSSACTLRWSASLAGSLTLLGIS